MNKLLSIFIVITTICNTCSIASSDDNNDHSNNKDVGIGNTYSNDFRKFVLTSTSRNNKSGRISTSTMSTSSRYLQDNNDNTDTTKVWTNERICNGTLEQFYVNDYERSMKPCTCSRTMNSTTGTSDNNTTTIPGLFTVNCDYSYCPQCINVVDKSQDSTTGFTTTTSNYELCGIVTNKNIFLEDIYNPAGALRQIQNTTSCMQYTIGSTDTVCITTNYDYTTIDITCTISVGCQQCTSCTVVKCTDDGTSKPINGSNANEIVQSALSYDCSNIINTNVNSTGTYDQCKYIPYTTKQSPALIINDPLSFIRYTREQQDALASCFEPNTVSISPFPPISPSSLFNNNCPPPSPNQSPVTTSSSTSMASVSPLTTVSSDYTVFIMSLIAFYFI